MEDEQLKQLVAEAQQHPCKSSQRRIALTKLVRAIQRSQQLSRQTKWSSLPNFPDLYNEALQQTLLEICNSIDKCNLQYPVMAWVNRIFNCRFIDLLRMNQKRGITDLPKKSQVHIINLTQLKTEIRAQQYSSEDEQLRKVVETDPEKFLEQEAIRNRPDANLRTIILLLLEGRKWIEISDKLQIPVSTLASFYQRRLPRIVTYLQKYVVIA